jgi:membrane-associated protein
MALSDTLTREILDFMRTHVSQYGYLLLFLLTFLETSAFLGLVAPGEAAVVLAGLFASRGPLQIGLVLPLAVVGAFLGDQTGYWLGRRFGTQVLERFGKYAFFDKAALAQVRRYYERHGGKTVLLGRFTAILRSFGPFVAGSSHMRYGVFALWSAIGCVAWGTLYSLIGYFFGESWDLIEKYLGRVGLIGFLLGVAVLVGALALRRRRKAKGEPEPSAAAGEEPGPVEGAVGEQARPAEGGAGVGRKPRRRPRRRGSRGRRGRRRP